MTGKWRSEWFWSLQALFPPTGYLRTVEAADIAGVQVNTIQQAIRRGNFRAFKQHGRWMVEEESFYQWAESGRRKKYTPDTGRQFIDYSKPVWDKETHTMRLERRSRPVSRTGLRKIEGRWVNIGQHRRGLPVDRSAKTYPIVRRKEWPD